MNSNESSLNYRSEFLVKVFKDFVDPNWSILEIGCGDGRNLAALQEAGYTKVMGIDKEDGSAIEDVEPFEKDVIFTMSCLFLIPPENEWVFEKIAKMAKKLIITIEGEVTNANKSVWGRDYYDVFQPFGFTQLLAQHEEVFNKYGVLRVMKRDDS